MSEFVAVYQLRHKFVNRQEDIPEHARQVVYYALAVGHHVGVMDCFTSLVDIPVQELTDWLAGLPEGPARAKLEGVLKWGEIEINRSHVAALLPVIDAQPAPAWAAVIAEGLRCMLQESAYYLMLRKHA